MKNTHKNDKNAQLSDRDNDRNKVKITLRLKELAGDRGNRELSRLWGLPASTINSYLNDEIGSIPSFDKMLMISTAERVSLDWLAGLNNQQPISSNNEEIEAFIRAIPKKKLAELAKRIEEVGLSSVLLDRKILQIVKMMNELPEEAIKEISLLANHAQYCAIVGVPFKPTCNVQGMKDASGRRA